MLARARSVMLALTAAWPRPAAAQAGAAPVGVGSEAAAEAIEGAWTAQARFERDRISTAAAARAMRSSGVCASATTKEGTGTRAPRIRGRERPARG